jgi:putative alpha-1,2-mannosidase
MPEVGPLKTGAAARASRLRHDREQTKPWHYGVTLEDSGIYAEMTGSARAGLLRFRFQDRPRLSSLFNRTRGQGKARFT